HPRPVVLIVALDVRALLGDQESDARVGVGLGVGAVADHLVRRPLLRRRTPREGLRRHLGERRTKPRGAVGVLLNESLSLRAIERHLNAPRACAAAPWRYPPGRSRAAAAPGPRRSIRDTRRSCRARARRGSSPGTRPCG